MRWIASTEKDAGSATLCSQKQAIESAMVGFPLDGLTQRLVKIGQVLRPVVKGMPLSAA
jgi:hypothetical protein